VLRLDTAERDAWGEDALLAETGANLLMAPVDRSAGFRTEARRFRRHSIQCRARIRIGTRHYAGYIHNISAAGAKLRTIAPIRRPGIVLLSLPDLPLLRCQLRWSNAYNAGVSFDVPLSRRTFLAWARTRQPFECAQPDGIGEIAELEPLG
jgi:hypothetical protein